jgi:hypothetical protein
MAKIENAAFIGDGAEGGRLGATLVYVASLVFGGDRPY